MSGAEPWRELARAAKGWLEAPGGEALATLAERARVVSSGVPAVRRDDWDRLVAGLGADEPDERRRARVEGIVRACRIFREGMRDWADGCDRIAGLGPATCAALGERGVRTLADLVWTLPIGWDDLRSPLGVREAARRSASGERVCVGGTVERSTLVPMRGRRAVRLVVKDATGDTLDVWWFFAAHGIRAAAKPGTRCLLVGRVTVTPPKGPRMAHPDLVVDEPAARGVRPRYARVGVAGKLLRRAIGAALDTMDPLPDPVPADVARREQMPPIDGVLRALHGKGGLLRAPPDDAALRAAIERMAWVEAFSRVWERQRAEERWRGERAPELPRDEAALARLRRELGFALTPGQERAIDAICTDLAGAAPMRRLLLGDVGTGKTAVALAAVAQCVAAGYQAAILAPTGVLAEQYVDALAPLVRACGREAALVAAGIPARERRGAEEGLAGGRVAVAVGTHALLAGRVTFARLGLVVVDEQHRLGVAQRLALVSKGARPHLLALSATPIPRTLALALRGDLATSTLDERPRGRPPVETELVARADAGVVERVREVVARGERAFFVSPRIEVDADDADDDASAAAVEHARELARALAPARVELVHGAMSADAARRAMRAFRRGEAQVLVGTTVVEVGIDVPEATLMVVDRAERFGLAQLHQLRGRVGRGERPGRAIFLYDEPLEDRARRRLEAICATTSGLDVARADLALRGAGDLWGTRQSGEAEELVFLDPASPPAWLARVADDARAIHARDPELALAEHRALALARARVAVAIAVHEEAG